MRVKTSRSVLCLCSVGILSVAHSFLSIGSALPRQGFVDSRPMSSTVLKMSKKFETTSETANSDVKMTPGDDPSLVYQREEVAEAFVNIRDTIPLATEQMDTMIRMVRHFQPTPKRWLDLGCGDGPLAERLLAEFPTSHGTLIDHSKPMLDLAKAKLAEHNDTLDFQQVDFSNEDFINTDDNKFDVIVSGFAIHHVSHSRKQALYRQIFDALTPGGIFLNMEHVATATKDLEDIFEAAFCDSMYKAFEASDIPKSRSEVEAAVRHDLSVDEEANILAPVNDQCEWLRDIGFVHVDCYFKFFILALFGGVKPR